MQQETSEKPEQAPGKPGEATSTLNAHHQMAPYWAALVGMAVVGVLYLFLPSRLIIGPNWLLLALEAVFIIPLALYLRSGREISHAATRTVAIVLLSILTLVLAIGVLLLIVIMATTPRDISALTLLRSAALLWGVNVLVFGLWYWEVDGGGAYKRHLAKHQAADFMFPQQADGNKSGWVPHFFDYLFLAFTGATALSPADTYPLSRPAKALMMIEALLSMTIVILLAARAVNILGS